MFDAAVINTSAGAFAAGLATGVHCAGMCGPLACLAAGGRESGRWSRAFGTGGYHFGRLFSYALIGALAGWMGRPALEAFSSSPARVLPWGLALALVAIGIGLDKKIPRPAGVGRWLFKAKLALGRRTPAVGGTLLGIATPLLPCAPLYIIFGLALVSGSAAAGAEFTAAFALGDDAPAPPSRGRVPLAVPNSRPRLGHRYPARGGPGRRRGGDRQARRRLADVRPRTGLPFLSRQHKLCRNRTHRKP